MEGPYARHYLCQEGARVSCYCWLCRMATANESEQDVNAGGSGINSSVVACDSNENYMLI